MRTRWIEVAIGIYPAWWRARYGEEVRAVSSDAIAGGHSPFRVAAGLFIGAIRTRIRGTTTPRQFPLWARRTRAWTIFTTVPAFVVLPLFFLTFRQGQRDGVPLVPSGLLTGPGHVASAAFGVLAFAGLLVTGVLVGAYVMLARGTGRRPAGRYRAGRPAFWVALCAGLVASAVAAGATALFALVALGFSLWGTATLSRRVKQDDVRDRVLNRLAPIPLVMGALAGLAWIASEVVGPHQYLDSRGVDVPLNGHPGLAHGLLIGAATALGVGWLVTFASLIVLVGATRPSLEGLRLGRIVSPVVSVLLSVMAGAGLVSAVALDGQRAPRGPGTTMVTTSWGHLWLAGALTLVVAAAASTSGAVASWRSWKVTARLER